MLRMVVMMLIEPRIELMPSRWTAKIVKSMPMPICTVSGAYIVQPTPGAPADHHRDLPVGEADEGRHDRAEDHDQAVHGGQLVEEVGVDELQAGRVQLGADRHRHDPADAEHEEAEPQVHRADVLVVGGGDPAHDPAITAVVVMVTVRVVVAADDCAHAFLLTYFRLALTSAGCTSPALLPQELRS